MVATLLSDECWLGSHETCSAPVDCDCLCHVRAADVMSHCLSCGDQLTPRYEEYAVCANCYGTTDDPFWRP